MYVILDDIKNRKLKQVYLLFGEEKYLIRQYRDSLIKNVTKKSNLSELKGDMNYLRIEGTDATPTAIVDFGNTIPFFADYRLLVVENSGLFEGDAGNKVAEFLNDIPEQTTILFVENTVYRTTKLFKAVEKYGHCAEFKQMTEDKIKQWIAKRAASEGKSITVGAVNEVIKRIGYDMSDISMELEKLFCYCLNKEVIEKSDVETIVTTHLSDHVFDMIAAMGRGDSEEALRLYYDLLGLRVPCQKIHSLIVRQFNQLYMVRELRDKGYDKRRIADKTGMKPFVVDKCLGQIAGFSLKGLRNALTDCAEYEQNYKLGNISDKLGLEIILVKYSNKEQRDN